MIPTRLTMQNFLAYRAPHPVVLEGVHLACLVGANGAGKSSLLDAVTWALWGKARTRRDNDLIHLGATDMYVELDFLHEGQKYRVIRRRSKRGSQGSGRLDLFIFDTDGKLNEIREGSSNATQRRINDLLRLDYDTFTNSAFLQQGQADAFTTQQPAKRKQILSTILGLEAWTTYEEAAKKRRDAANERVNGLDGRLSQLEEEIAREPQLKRELAEAETAHAESRQLLDAAESLLKEVEGAPEERRSTVEKKEERDRRKADHERDLQSTTAEMERRAQQIQDYTDILDNRAEIEAGFQNLEAARSASDALNQKLRDLKKLDDQISELEQTLATERTRLEAEQSGLHQQIISYEAQVNGANGTDREQVTATLAALEQKQHERETLREQFTALRTEDAEIRAENTALYTTMTELRERIDQLKIVEGAECPLCGQPLTEGHRQEMLASLQETGETQGTTYRNNQARMHTLADEQEQIEATIKALSDELADLPRLQQRAGELQAQAEAAAEAQRQLVGAKARLGSVQAALGGDDYAHDARAQLTMLTAQKDALGYDEQAHDEQAQALQQYRQYAELHAQLRVAEQSLPPLEEAQSVGKERVKRLNRALTDLHKELVELEERIGQLNVLVETYNQRHEDVMRLRTAESQANEKVIVARQALRALDERRRLRDQYQAQREEIAEERGVYDELRNAFGKNGVPAMMIETAIPELEAITNDLLTRMTDGRMAVRFSTQREKVTGGTTETLDIEIADELGTRGYELYSGGEAFRINFAIRVALSKLLARRAGAHLETLFIDEGFGTQDADGRARLVEAINAIKDDFALILVITHIDDLKDAFPVHIYIEKTPNGSLVDVR